MFYLVYKSLFDTEKGESAKVKSKNIKKMPFTFFFCFYFSIENKKWLLCCSGPNPFEDVEKINGGLMIVDACMPPMLLPHPTTPFSAKIQHGHSLYHHSHSLHASQDFKMPIPIILVPSSQAQANTKQEEQVVKLDTIISRTHKKK